jgi:ABC-type uncharacterized transport system substrate-binding protein
VLASVQRETRTIPTVFVGVPDPVGDGFVASLARPGGNPTGLTNFEFAMGAKWLEILREMAPRTKRVAVLFLFRRSSAYVDHILRGDRPDDLPVQAPTKFELAVNLKTARDFGLTVPPSLLTLADEVIE